MKLRYLRTGTIRWLYRHGIHWFIGSLFFYIWRHFFVVYFYYKNDKYTWNLACCIHGNTGHREASYYYVSKGAVG